MAEDPDGYYISAKDWPDFRLLLAAFRNNGRQLAASLAGQSRPRQHLLLLGKTDAAHAKGTSGTISIYAGTTKGSETDTGRNVEGVYNRFASLDSGVWVHLHWVAGGWELTAADCG